jgi:hypothetical protein
MAAPSLVDMDNAERSAPPLRAARASFASALPTRSDERNLRLNRVVWGTLTRYRGTVQNLPRRLPPDADLWLCPRLDDRPRPQPTAAYAEGGRLPRDPGRKGKVARDATAGPNFLRPGDTLVVSRVDRLARSIRDLQNLVHELRERGVTFRATEQPIDTRTTSAKAFLDMLGVFAEFETNLRRERQLEGITAAKARGAYGGRKRSIDDKGIRRLHSPGLGPTEIARQLGIGRASDYRALARADS